MTATAAPPADTLVSQPAREVLFAAVRSELRLVHTPTYDTYAATGRKLGREHGITVEFREGMLRIPTEGDVITANRRKIPAPELISWLDEHPLNGDGAEGFYRIQQVAPPVSAEEIDTITEAAMSFDSDRLSALLDQERAGWNRAAVVGTVEKRLAQIREFTAQLEAQQAAQAEEEKAPKAAAKKAAGK